MPVETALERSRGQVQNERPILRFGRGRLRHRFDHRVAALDFKLFDRLLQQLRQPTLLRRVPDVHGIEVFPVR